MYLKMSSVKWRPFCPEGDELSHIISSWRSIIYTYSGGWLCWRRGIRSPVTCLNIEMSSYQYRGSWNRALVWLKSTGTKDSETRKIINRVQHDDVIQWKHFPRYWPFVRGMHRSPMDSRHKAQWRGALVFSFDLRLNKRLSKQSKRRWCETPSCSLWRHCNGCNQKMIFQDKGIPVIKIRLSWDRLIFIMGIPTQTRRNIYIETSPCITVTS